MRWSMWLLFAVAACGGASEPAAPAAAADAAERWSPVAMARQVVAELSAGKTAAVTARFDENMAAALPGDALAELWSGIEAQIGAFQAQRGVRVEDDGALAVVTVTCAFARADIDVRVVVNGQRRIAGLDVRPAAAGKDYVAPPYVHPERYEERGITVGTTPWKLPGTLSVPLHADKAAAVVLVHGSGPQDRDETIGPNKPFRDLALGLASAGIVVLRYEKRTRYHGEAVAEAYGDALTVREETIDDALAAVAALRGVPEVDGGRIFVAGHSLGGTVMPRIAQADPAVHGFVILGGATRPVEDAYLGQLEWVTGLDGKVSRAERALLERARAQVARVKTLAPEVPVAPADLPLAIPQAYWLDLAAHQATTLAAEARPILVLHGDRDYQVTAEDFAGYERLLGGKPNATLTRYASLNHLFMAGKGPSSPAEYLQDGHVAGEVIADIAAWISAH
jgi:uncharacterized protein